MQTERTAAEVAADFKAHLEELRTAYDNEDYEAMNPLCIDTTITKRIWLGMGGPNIYIDVTLDANNRPISGKYVYAWFPTYKHYELDEVELEEIASLYGITD